MNSSFRSVPEYTANEIHRKNSKYCVCVFVINEGNRLLNQLKKMQTLSNIIDIVIADGGSSDGSTNIEGLNKLSVNTLLTKTGKGKLGAQMRMAFSWAIDRGYKGIIAIDGNNKDGIEAIPNFVEHLELGYDHIQGSRFVKGGFHENTPLSRLIGLKILHAPLIRFASGFPYTDTTNGFRGYSSKLLSSNHLNIFRDVFDGYELHYFLAIEAARNGFKCTEIPVSRIYPAHGKTPTKISPVKGNLNVIKKLLKACLGSYRVN